MEKGVNWSFFRLILILIGIGLFTELLLIEHYESIRQLIPLLLIPLAVLVFVFSYYFPSKWLKISTISIMSACVMTGVLGIIFHLQGNLAFEKEMYPTMSPGNLFLKSIKGATPLLAPGSMIGLGLLGVFYLISKKSN